GGMDGSAAQRGDGQHHGKELGLHHFVSAWLHRAPREHINGAVLHVQIFRRGSRHSRYCRQRSDTLKGRASTSSINQSSNAPAWNTASLTSLACAEYVAPVAEKTVMS